MRIQRRDPAAPRQAMLHLLPRNEDHLSQISDALVKGPDGDRSQLLKKSARAPGVMIPDKLKF